MKIINEASRLFFAMFALILVAMLTTPSSLTSATADAVLAKNKTAKAETKSASSNAKKEKLVKNKKYGKTLADLF
jgi:hypothetical protein